MTTAPAVASPSPPVSADRPQRFRLDGPTRGVDRRTNAIRADIADLALAGILFAPHYAAPQPFRCLLPATMMLASPDSTSRSVSELLLGEVFHVIDVSGGWAWGFSAVDHYVGYVHAAALGQAPAPTLRITARHALVFAQADIKAPVAAIWPMGALFDGASAGGFWQTGAGFVHVRHAAPIDRIAPDPVAVAEALLGTPYRWGGRGADGIDCSGLVQVALGLAGIAAPRDSDQQRDSLGAAIAADAPLARGDLIFFPGHVGMMADATRLIHANAHAMAVTCEPLVDVIARLAPDHAEPVLARKRIAS